jgi:serine/threonine-protein kinase
MRLSPGDVVGGKYRIIRLIGDGGMGAVFEARHEVLGSSVALKFLHAELAKRPGLAQRFLQEARVSASIQSPHVTRVTDVEQTQDGSPYLVMELLVGESLQSFMDRVGRAKRDQALDFALQILAGLEAAHALGVVHRDLKPDNVFITPSGGGPILKLLDFGIAKLRESQEYQRGLTRPGSVMGTPEYMAPEQLYSAERVDHRADIYSLGVILYELLSGARPAYGEDAAQIVAVAMQGQVKHLSEHEPSLPGGLVEAVHRALEPDRIRRFASATEFRLALLPFVGELSHAGRLAATPPPASVVPLESVAPGPRLSNVAPTLPPEDDAPEPARAAGGGPKHVTEDAPRELMQRIATAMHPAPPAHGGSAPLAASSLAARPYGAPPTGQLATRTPRRSRTWGAILALLLGVGLTAALIAVIVLVRRSRDDTPYVPLDTTPPPTALSAQPESSAPPANTNPPVTQPWTERPSPTRPPAPAPHSPTPNAPSPTSLPNPFPSGSVPTLPFPLPLPSGLPALPSTLPPLPSGFPPIWGPPSQAQPADSSRRHI